MCSQNLRMPGIDGIKLLKKIKETCPQTEVIIVTGQATIETAVESLKGGAFDYILKPFNISELITATQKCLDFSKLRRQENIFRETTYLYQLTQEATRTKSEKALLSFILERMAKTLNAERRFNIHDSPEQRQTHPDGNFRRFQPG